MSAGGWASDHWRGVRIFNSGCLGDLCLKVRGDLVTHCRSREAEETVKRIEADVVKSTGRNLPPAHGKSRGSSVAEGIRSPA